MASHNGMVQKDSVGAGNRGRRVEDTIHHGAAITSWLLVQRRGGGGRGVKGVSAQRTDATSSSSWTG